MRILHVVAPAPVGGLERVIAMLAHGQASGGHEVHVAAILPQAGADLPSVSLARSSDGVRAHPILLANRAYRRERAAIRNLCGRLRPDIVHTHGYRPDVVDSGVSRQLGIPTVTTVHGFTGGGWKNRIYEHLQRRAYRRFDAVIAVSRPLGQQLLRRGIPGDRIHVVQNAWRETVPPFDRVTARRFFHADEQAYRIGWVGRLSGEKGADVLLDAFTHLTDLPLSLSLVGHGAEERALRAQARRLGGNVARRVRWHGVVPDMARLFAAFDVFVLSSRTEGTPIVLFEAMAAGVPIVATSVGGVPDVVSSAEAVLVPPADPRALADAIRSVHRDPAAAHARAARARTRLLRDFAVAPWIRRYDEIYQLVSNTADTNRPARVTVATAGHHWEARRP